MNHVLFHVLKLMAMSGLNEPLVFFLSLETIGSV